ncbi:MAG: zinc ribbon domain-containing protein [Actinobacteria bacterium]|nr:zinc ribbon domain-containing protein [Actinomycetota bacterium]
MASRFSFFARPTPPPTEGVSDPAQVEPASSAARPPRPPSMRREREGLVRRREIEIRDVGGLALEMYRRDRFKPDLLLTRCAEVLALEERIHELDSFLAAAEVAARGPGAETCRCGAPIVRGSHFCSHCGRPASETPPVVTCGHCGQALPADVNFCPVCGNGVAAESYVPDEDDVVEGDALDETMVAPPLSDPERGAP